MLRLLTSDAESESEPVLWIAALLIAFCIMSEAAVSLLGEVSETKMQNEFMILMLLVLAYFLGFANARERKTTPEPKLKTMGMNKSHSMSHGKNATPDGGQSSKKLGLSTQAQSIRDNRGAALGACAGLGGAAAGSAASSLDEGSVGTLMQNIKRSEQWETDLRTIETARKEGITSSAYAAVMGACNRCNDKDTALELINHMLANGVAADSVHAELGGNCNGPAAKFFKLVADILDEQVMQEKSLQLLEVIKAFGLAPTNLVQNRIICAWKSKLPDHILEAFMKMKDEGVHLSATAYRCIMAAHERTEPERTLRLYDEMVEKGIKLDRVAFNAALCACSHLGMTEQALELFEQMPQHALVPNGKTYGTLIRACTASNKVKEAMDLFDSMRMHNIEPNRFAFHDAIHCCVKAKRLSDALTLYKDMVAAKVPPCDNTCQYLSKACQKRGWTEIADRIMDDCARVKKSEGRFEHHDFAAE